MQGDMLLNKETKLNLCLIILQADMFCRLSHHFWMTLGSKTISGSSIATKLFKVSSVSFFFFGAIFFYQTKKLIKFMKSNQPTCIFLFFMAKTLIQRIYETVDFNTLRYNIIGKKAK